jgi:hypothetical protein
MHSLLFHGRCALGSLVITIGLAGPACINTEGTLHPRPAPPIAGSTGNAPVGPGGDAGEGPVEAELEVSRGVTLKKVPSGRLVCISGRKTMPSCSAFSARPSQRIMVGMNGKCIERRTRKGACCDCFVSQ